MGLKEIIGKLDWLLNTEKSRASRQVEAIELLVAQLVDKEAKYNVRLGSAVSALEREKLERKIKVSRAQIAKGRAAARELRAQADPL